MNFAKILKTKILSKLLALALIISLTGVFWPITELDAYAPETSGDITITVTSESPSNLTQIGKSATNVNFLKIVVENSISATSSYLWSDLVVTYVGAAEADIATDGVNLHLDDGDGAFETSSDVIIFERSLTAGSATFAMTGVEVTIAPSSSKTYFVSLDTSASPVNSDTVGVRISQNGMTFINQDTLGSINDLPKAHRIGPTGFIDSQVPTVTKAETGDRNADGKIDYYKLTFSENINDSSINGYAGANIAISTSATHGFAVAGYADNNNIYLGASAAAAGLPADSNNDNILYLGFTAGDAADTDAKPQLTYAAATGLLTDLAYPANALANIADGNLTETDKAAPVLVSAASTNILQAGNIKAASEVTLTFSESVTATSPTFTLTTKRYTDDTPQPYSEASFDGTTVSISGGAGTTKTLTFAGATAGNNTSDFTMGEGQTQGYWTSDAQFKFSAIGAGTIKDAADLDVSTSGDYVSLDAEDGTAPITVKVVGYDDGSLAGAANDGKLDRIEMYFNEALNPDIYETADFTTLTVNNGAGDQALSLSSAAASTTDNLVVLDLTGSVSGTGVIVLKYKDDTNAGGHDIADLSAQKYSAGSEKTPATIDAVKPVIVAVANYDVDTDGGAAAANGKNDEILITFSENVDDGSFAAGTDILVNGTGVKFEVPASTQNAGDTGNTADDYLLTVINNTQANEFAGTAKVAVVILGSGISDLASPTPNVNLSQTFAADATGNSDNAAPIIIGSEYRDDTGTDGAVDQVRLTFSEPITYSPYEDADWSVTANGITNLNITDGTAAASTTLDLTATADAGVTGGVAPAVHYVAANGATDVTDGTNVLADVTKTLDDAAAPVKVSMAMQDAGANGKVDKVVVTYSEDLVATTATTSWAVTGIPSNGTFDSVSELTGVITLAIAEGTSTADTSVGSMTVALDNTAEIADAAGNVAADFAAAAPDDAAAPVLIAAYAGDKGGIPGVMNETGDKYRLVFSEPMNGPSGVSLNHEADFVFGGGATEGDNFPSRTDLSIRLGRITTNVANDTFEYVFVTADSDIANVNLVTPETDTINVDTASFIENSIEDLTGNDLVAATGGALTLESLDVTPPAFSKAEAVSSTTIQITFAEPITVIGTPDWGTVVTAGGGLTATGGSASGTVLTVTVNTLGTDFTAADLAISAGTVEDATGNDNAAISGQTIADKQAPALVSAKFIDLTHLEMTFSEAMGNAASVDETKISITNNASDSIAVTDGSAAVAGAKVTVTTASVTTTDFSISAEGQGLDLSAGAVQDLAAGTPNANVEDLNNAVTDGIAPALVSAETQDIGADGSTRNGKVDHLKLTFSEPIADSAINNYSAAANYLPASLAVDNVSNEAVDFDADALDNNVLYIIFDEAGAGVYDTGVVNQDITWTGASVTIKDLASPANQAGDLAGGDITEADAAAPVIVAAATGEEDVTNNIDHDIDGYLDKLVLTYSESVDVGDAIGGQFDVADTAGNVLNAEYVADGDDGDTTVTVYFTGNKAAYDTNGTPNITFATVSNAVKASVGGQDAPDQTFAGTTDGAAPVPVSASSTRAIINGQVPSGTVFTIGFSEPIVSDNLANLDLGASSEFVFKYDGTNPVDQTKFYAADGGADDPLAAGEFSIADGNLLLTFSDATNKDDDGGVIWTASAAFNVVTLNVGAEELDDGAANNPAKANGVDIAVAGLLDTDAPQVSSIATMDDDGDGTLDMIGVVFNEKVKDSTFASTSWTIGNLTVAGVLASPAAGDVTDDETIYIGVTSDSSTDTGYIPDVTAIAGGIQDLSNNLLGVLISETISETDGAAPVITAISTMDDDSNGKIDMLKATVSESVNDSSFDSGQDSNDTLTLSGVLASPVEDIADDNIIYIGVTEVAANTGAIGDYTANAGLINDRAAPSNAMAAVIGATVAETDGAAPVIVAAANYDNDIDGTNDEVYITFSETLENNVTLTDHLGTVAYGGSTGTISLVTAFPAGHGQTDADSDQYITLVQNDNTGGFGNTDTNQLVFSGATIADRVTPANTFTAQTVLAAADPVVTATDAAIPVLMSSSCVDAEPDGKINACTLTYSETLATQPAVTMVSAKGRANEAVTVSSAAASGTDVAVTLDNTDSDNWTGIIKITYTVGNGITDGTNNAASLDNEALTDDVAPFALLADAATKSNPNTPADGYTKDLTIKYSEDISTSTPSASGFTVLNSANAAVTVAGTSVSTETLTLTLAQSGNNDTSKMSVAYDPAVATIKVIDVLGNEAPLFSDTEITDGVAPAMMTAVPVNTTTINVTFSDPILANSVIATDFFVNTATGGQWPSSARVDGNVVILTTAQAFVFTELTTVGLVGAVSDLTGTALTGPLTVAVTGTGTLTVASIAVTPASPTLVKGASQQFVATATYTNGTTAPVTDSAIWNSSNEEVATIATTTGLALAAGQGSTVIKATIGTISGITTLTVTGATLSSIDVTPATAIVGKGLTQQFVVTGTYSDDSHQVITSQATWTSSSSTIATIDANGLATVQAESGTATITADVLGKTATASITASDKTLASIKVTPTTPTVTRGSVITFAAVGTYSDGSTSTLTGSVVWSSADALVADAPNASGTTTALKVGSTEITAASGIISGSTVLTVTNATLSSIDVTPAAPAIAKGATKQFQATGSWSDNSTSTVTQNAYWTSSDEAIATIDANTGLATAVATGTVTITAEYIGQTDTAELTVSDATVSSIAVTPAWPNIAKGTTQQFAAVAAYSDGSTTTVTTDAVWSSSNTSTATIDAGTGLAASRAQGSTEITATFGGQSGTATLTVSTPIWTSIEIIDVDGGAASLPIDDWLMLQAWGIKSDNTRENITDRAEWISSSTTVASFETYYMAMAQTETLYARAAGTTTVTARLDGATSNEIIVTVLPASGTPEITAPSDVTITNASTYTITGTSAPNASIHVSSNSNSNNTLAGGDGVWSVSVNLSSNQDNNFTAYAVETGKGPSLIAIVPLIIQDSQSPIVTIVLPTGGDTNDPTPELLYETEDGAAIVVKVDGTPVATRTGESFAALADGSHTVRVEATDAALNMNWSSVNFRIDQSVPGLLDATYHSGVYNEAVTVLLTNGNGVIYYTTDNSTPTAASTVYTADGVEISASTVLKARSANSSGTLGPVATFTYVIKAGADLAGLDTQTITLPTGKWSIFSTPKIVTSLTAFNTIATTTSLTGLAGVSYLGASGGAYLMEGSAWKNLVSDAINHSGHPHYHLDVPQPLYGYVINNRSGHDITLTLTYKTTLATGENLFDRSLAAGWNSVGAADYQTALPADSTAAINIDTSDGIGGMSPAVLGYVLDYTANANNNSVYFADGAAKLRASGSNETVNIINPRETRGYLVFSQAGSFAGSQYNGPR